MPSSFRDLMVAPIRLSCGSFWKSSAHSTIRAFSFSHTLGWACRGTDKQTAVMLSPASLQQRGVHRFSIVNHKTDYTPCSAHSALHWQTPGSRFLNGRSCHSLTHRHQATAREEEKRSDIWYTLTVTEHKEDSRLFPSTHATELFKGHINSM